VTHTHIVGFDPSLNNWGVAKGTLYVNERRVVINELDVLRPNDLEQKASVAQNDLHRISQLYQGALRHLEGANAVFVEAPHGSQSARAAVSYASCLSVIVGLRIITQLPFFIVTANDVKQIVNGTNKAEKSEVIEWATEKHPEAPWPTQTKKGTTTLVTGKAEHMADAIGAIYAGMETPEFHLAIKALEGGTTH
jgi:Holliday junction resolvasome RuvABC endonuclease subunit